MGSLGDVRLGRQLVADAATMDHAEGGKGVGRRAVAGELRLKTLLKGERLPHVINKEWP